MQEFSCEVVCPHCSGEQTETFEFNFDEAGMDWCNSQWHKFQCYYENCDKEFWAQACVSFNVSADTTSKKKPKDF